MQNAGIVLLTRDEMLGVDGGGCALLGAFTAVLIVAEQWWAVAGALISAYNSGCFD